MSACHHRCSQERLCDCTNPEGPIHMLHRGYLAPAEELQRDADETPLVMSDLAIAIVVVIVIFTALASVAGAM